MSATALLDEIVAAGIRLRRDGDDLIAEFPVGVDLDHYRVRIIADKTALLAVLRLQAEIVVAATADPQAFDRAAYNELWASWYAVDEQENST